MLEIKKLDCSYGDRSILENINFSLDVGEFVCLLGANGCGKSTLLKHILGFLPIKNGNVYLDGISTTSISVKKFAQQVAYVPQAHGVPFSYQVIDVVLMGRTPYLARWQTPSASDREFCMEILKKLKIDWMADKKYPELSGGQKQMVMIARALAQEPRYLLLDEPTTGLDYGNQYLVLTKLAELSSKEMGILMVTHDPAHAIYCGNRVIALKDGAVLKDGAIDDVITESVLKEIYDLPIKVRTAEISPHTEYKVCIPFEKEAIEPKKTIKFIFYEKQLLLSN